MSQPNLKDYLLLHLCIIFWGFTSILGVLSSLQAPYLVVYRTGLSFLSLIALMLFWGKKISLPRQSIGPLLLAGFLTAFHWTTFFASAQLSNVSTCLAGMSTTALWTSLLEPWMTRTKFRWVDLVLAAIVSVGLLLIYKSDFSMAYGLSISIISAISCSVFSILNKGLVKHHSPMEITTWEMGIAFISSLIFLPILKMGNLIPDISIPLPTGADWLNILFLAWVCTVFAYTMSVELMKKFSAFAMNLTVNLEPVYGIALGLLIFGEKEKMQGLFYLGLLFILGGVFAYPLLRLGQKKATV
jgi:drug/metabolite transporter (DMT)-like permease